MVQREPDQRRLTAITVTNKLRNPVGRVTPCAPQPASDLPNGAHGVTRPTQPLDHVSKSLCRHTRLRSQSVWLPTPLAFFNRRCDDVAVLSPTAVIVFDVIQPQQVLQ